jgi:hypothetical protein
VKKQTICLDFDGVLHRYSQGWQGETVLEGPSDGARDFCLALQLAGYDLVIQSSRAKSFEGKTAIMKWLAEHSFPAMRVEHEKPIAVLYVDDRGYRFNPEGGNTKDEFDLLLQRIGDGQVLQSWA